MEDKKLIAAIVGAITAYIQMEQEPLPVTSESKPKPQASDCKSPDGKLIKEKLER